MDTKPAILILGILLVPLFLLLLSYKLTMAFYPLTVEQEKVFLFLDEEQELPPMYTASEVSHLQDVAAVMNKVNIAFYVFGIIVVGILAYSWKQKEQLQKMSCYGGMATIGLVVLILAAVFLNFNGLFTLFHQLFFPQGNWQFAADSLLIQTFPLEFFVMMGRRIFVLALVFGGMMIGTAYLLKKYVHSANGQ